MNMKAVFVAYNQAYYEEIAELLASFGCRGFTRWNDIAGQGGVDGEPHLGNHTWPTMNDALLAFVPDDKVDGILEKIRQKDENSPALGLRAFVWAVEKSC